MTHCQRLYPPSFCGPVRRHCATVLKTTLRPSSMNRISVSDGQRFTALPDDWSPPPNRQAVTLRGPAEVISPDQTDFGSFESP